MINGFFYWWACYSLNNYYYYNASELIASCEQENQYINDKENDYQRILDGLEKEIENSNISLLKNLIRFNINVENSFEAKSANDDQVTATKFNIEKDGKYIEVTSSEKKELLPSLSLSELRKIKPNDFVYKFFPIQEEGISESTRLILVDTRDESIKFHIELHWISFLWLLIVSIPASWGLLLLWNAIEKFIYSGKPVIEEKIKQKSKNN